MTDTIFALASGAPPAGIAVVRVSGPGAREVLAALAGPVPPDRHMSLRTLRDPADGMILDRGLVVFFPGPGTATGEDLAELHLHGGRAIVAAVEAVLAGVPGCRPARAGEFTWRAFRNGVLDLVGVESLSDLLRAETEAQRRAALAGTALGAKVESWQRDILLASALVEAALDQSDEDDVRPDEDLVLSLVRGVADDMAQMLARPATERLFDGIRVVFAGPPNVGKSSLINALAGRDAAIASPVAGTTRDVIEVPVRLGGTAFVLTDTAGLRDPGADPVEAIGIARARERIDAADLLVWMGDGPAPDVVSAGVIPIHARCDARPGPRDRLPVSAVTGEGLTDLAEALVDKARALLPREGEAVLNRRQREIIAIARSDLVDAHAASDELVRAELLRRARTSFDLLTGRAGTENMLDALFSTFCVGK